MELVPSSNSVSKKDGGSMELFLDQSPRVTKRKP